MSAPGAAVAKAWQAALAAEHRAVFAYALLGPRLTTQQSALAVTCSDAHEQLRDRTAAALGTAGVPPVGPKADYPDLYPVADANAARRLAVRVEDDCAAAWRWLYLQAASVAAPPAGLRDAAQAALTASALRSTQWRRIDDPTHVTVAFPGITSA
ncbi:MAG: DUF4439 domain-containing protein [Jatrophihabitans sp.]|uniref:DUF4439 domain-containing protein n=1 Tax=Jatrophihabitans sp. TaxID=1932789 RepID=UPI003F8152A2